MTRMYRLKDESAWAALRARIGSRFTTTQTLPLPPEGTPERERLLDKAALEHWSGRKPGIDNRPWATPESPDTLHRPTVRPPIITRVSEAKRVAEAILRSNIAAPREVRTMIEAPMLADVAVRPRGKYGNAKTGGYASKKEAQRAFILKLMQDAGELRNLKEKTRFLIIPEQRDERGKIVERACFYECDFEYDELSRGEWRHVVEDTKSDITKTPQYRIKKKLMLFVHKIRVRET